MSHAIIPVAAILVLAGAGLAACGESDPAAGPSKAATAGSPKVDPARLIEGTVTAPEGVSLEGVRAIACLTPQETCLQEAEADVVVEDGVGRFTLVVPTPGNYHVMLWKDVDGDGALTVGDYQALTNNKDAVASGQILSPVTLFQFVDGEMTANLGGAPMGTATDFSNSRSAVARLGLAGSWSQSSVGSELVWGPEIKFQPGISTSGFGTNLGGTFGAGSQTNTTIVYSYKPMQVRRSMTMTVQPDGRFHWVATQQRNQGSCRSVRQEKFGRVVRTDDKVEFVVVDARQSCGGARSERLDGGSETFTLAREGAGFRLTADKGVNWVFQPSS